MKVATITEAKNRLSALIDLVKSGETVLIVDRGIPVARLQSAATPEDTEGRIARLERAGLVRRGTAPPPLELILSDPPRLHRGGSVLQALIEERREGR